MLFALALVFLFVFINGISCGISDSNPISSAFVVSVLLMSALGLQSTSVAMIAASILLVSCTVGVDMQQDRSTGWRLGSNRTMQFRYQAVGIAMGGVLCVVFAKLFMSAYPQLRIDTFTHPEARVGVWQSAMTFKFVGAIRNLGSLPAYKLKALEIGLGIGLVTEITRKLLARSAGYKRMLSSGRRRFQRRLGGGRDSAPQPLCAARSAASSIYRPRCGSPPAACSPRSSAASLPSTRPKSGATSFPPT